MIRDNEKEKRVPVALTAEETRRTMTPAVWRHARLVHCDCYSTFTRTARVGAKRKCQLQSQREQGFTTLAQKKIYSVYISSTKMQDEKLFGKQEMNMFRHRKRRTQQSTPPLITAVRYIPYGGAVMYFKPKLTETFYELLLVRLGVHPRHGQKSRGDFVEEFANELCLHHTTPHGKNENNCGEQAGGNGKETNSTNENNTNQQYGKHRGVL